jgi:hypothetical protein
MVINEGALDGDREVRLNDTIEFVAISRCLDITTSNFILDCQNNNIIPVNGIEQFFGSPVSNISIINCNFINSSLTVGIFGSPWVESNFINLSFEGSSLYLEIVSSTPNNNLFKNIILDNNSYFQIEDGFNNTFDNLSIYANYNVALASKAINNTFKNSYFESPIRFYTSGIEAASGNIFYNNIFAAPVNITSDNWSLTINHFNYSGQGNTYGGLNTSGKICFDDPLNLSCDYFASPLVLSSQNTVSSLFHLGGFLSTLLSFFLLFLYLGF